MQRSLQARLVAPPCENASAGVVGSSSVGQLTNDVGSSDLERRQDAGEDDGSRRQHLGGGDDSARARASGGDRGVVCGARLGTSGSRTVGCPRRRRGSGSGSAVVGVRSLCGPSGGLGRVVRSPGRSLDDCFGTACLACVARSGGGARRGSTSDAQTSSARRVVVEIRQPAARREAAAKLGQGDKPASDEPVTQRMLWDALDAGEDPTATDGDDGVGGDNGAKPGSSH